jgi:ribosomal protein S12 methylthiotransferase accessory factor
VVPLGSADVLDPEHDPHARVRAAADIHLTAQAALIGPWGGGADAAACGGCLGMRWQRLRTRSERDALEIGTVLRSAAAHMKGSSADLSAEAATGFWPILLDHVVDAVWWTYRTVVGASSSASSLPTSSALARHVLPLVTRLDLETLQLATVPLLAEAHCPYCTTASLGPIPFDGLASRAKPAPDAYRLRTPASYQLPYQALANPVCGVLGAATWQDVTSPTTAPVAGTVFMRGYAGLTDVTWSGQANSFASSRDLAFLEGLERYAGTHSRRGEPPIIAAYDDLPDALDPRTCGMYAPETYETDPMVSPFSPTRPIPWVRGYSLRDQRPILVPARLCYYSAGVRADNFVFECSNGCAIGGSPAEATLFGLLELIERDAFLLAWYGGARLTEIDIDSCDSPALRAMVDRAALQGYDVHAFDNRVDLALPVVTGLAVRCDGGPGTLAFAASAGFDPRAAIEGAVSEILTYIPHLPRQVRERPDELAAMAEDFRLVRRLPDHAALFGLPQMAQHAKTYLEPAALRSADELYRDWEQRRPRTDDLLDDVMLCRDELVSAGFDVIVVDQTPPEQERLGLHTVCTLAPGLLSIDFGWSRQRALRMPRLRTAFRRAGWRTDDLADHELRVVPHPFP